MKQTKAEIIKLSVLTTVCIGLCIFHDNGIGFLISLVAGFILFYCAIDWLRLLLSYRKWYDSGRTRTFEYKTDFTSAKSIVKASKDYPSSRLTAPEEQQIRTIVKYVQRELKK